MLEALALLSLGRPQCFPIPVCYILACIKENGIFLGILSAKNILYLHIHPCGGGWETGQRTECPWKMCVLVSMELGAGRASVCTGHVWLQRW